MKILTTTVASSLAASAVIAMTGGCLDLHNTTRSRQAATALTTQLTAYRDAQDARVKRLNEEYRDLFAKLMDTLEALSQAELQQGRDGDAQSVADSLIADEQASLRGRFRTAFANAVKAQRERIRDADLATVTVRENYAKSYSDVKLEIAKLNTVIKNLEAMSSKPSDIAQLDEAIKIIGMISKAYEEARERAATRATTAADSGAGS
jgi:hypothetical protein